MTGYWKQAENKDELEEKILKQSSPRFRWSMRRVRLRFLRGDCGVRGGACGDVLEEEEEGGCVGGKIGIAGKERWKELVGKKI